LKTLDLDSDIKANEYMSDIFLNQNNELVVEGDLIKNTRLAATLEALVKKDNIIYSEDDIARELVNELNEDVTNLIR